jgi:hypothetical protein
LQVLEGSEALRTVPAKAWPKAGQQKAHNQGPKEVLATVLLDRDRNRWRS